MLDITGASTANSARGIYGNGVSITNSTVTVTSAKAAFNNVPTVNANENIIYYGTDETAANEQGAKSAADLSSAYSQKYVRIEPYDHTHNWSYSANGDTITATCTADGCLNTNGGYVTISEPNDLTYTGSKIEAVVDNQLSTGATVNIVYTDNTTDGYPVNAGAYTAKITIDDKEISVDYTIASVSIESASVTVGGTYTYDGTAKEPTDITVILGGKPLTKDTDYTVSKYSDNVNAGTAKVIIKGIGNYEGEATGTFTITDETDPTGEIKIGENGWKKFINTITFGFFYKDNVDVTVTADGTGSDIVKVEYLFSNSALDKNNMPVAGWEEVTESDGEYKFSIKPANKGSVYVRITDEGGNAIVINSEGIVVYTDAEAVTKSVFTTYKAGENKNITVNLNHNTVKSVFCGETELTGEYYSFDTMGTITLKSDYLDTLSVGEYSFIVYYNPVGETTDKVTLTTTFSVTVDKASISDANVAVSGSYTYNASAHTPEPTVTLDGITLTKDVDYTVSYSNNVNAGTATVTVTGKGNYKDSASTTFSISNAKLTDVVVLQDTELTYNGNMQTPTVSTSVVSVNNQTVTFTYSTDPNGTYGTMPTFVEVGIYTVYFKATAPNHNEATGSFTVTMSEAENSWTATPSIDGWTYGQSANAYEASAKFGTVKVIYTGKANDGSDYNSETAPTKAGSYTATFTVDGTENYSGLSEQVNFTIARADYDMSGAKWNYTVAFDYDGKSHTVWFDETSLPNGVTISNYTGNTASAVGKYTANVSLSYDDDNYNKPDFNTLLNWEIKNDWNPTEYIISNPNDNGWLREELTIIPAEGYMISTTNTAEGVWENKLTYSAETADGSVTFYLKNVEDGTISLGKTVTYKIDTTPATGTVTFTDAKTTWDKVLEAISFGIYVNTDQKVTVTTDDTLSGVAKVEYYETKDILGIADVQVLENSKWTQMTNNSVTVSAEDAKQFVYYIRITDNAGNVTYLSTDGAEYDLTAPVISGIENGKTFYTTQKVTVTDKNIESITLNGEAAEANITLDGNKEATYTIVATDKAGNSTTVTITMKPISELSAITENVTPENKTDLENAKAEFEKALEDNGGNYTDEEKKAIEDELKNIEDALEVIGDVEEVEELIGKLPENITKNDEDVIKAADDAYNALTDYEKSLVDEDAKKALDDAKATLAELNKPADSTSPNTGDNSNLWMWFAVAFIGGGLLLGSTILKKKDEIAK